MTILVRLWCFLFLTELWLTSNGLEWSYPEQVKEGWSGICASGQKQLPIDLITEGAYTYTLEPVDFVHYDTMTKGNLSNNGHTAVLHVEQPCSVSVTTGGLHDLYKLDEIHFHWKSEHTIDNKHFVLETHFVHYNSKYKSRKEALEHHQSLTVIGVLFHVVEEDNQNLEAITDAIEKITDFGSVSALSIPFSPQQLLPVDRLSFFRYEGSLTTPPCLEIVTWTVFTQSLPISRNQLEMFKTLNSKSGLLDYNFRETKPLNNRYIYLMSDAKLNSSFKFTIKIIVMLCVVFTLQLLTY